MVKQMGPLTIRRRSSGVARENSDLQSVVVRRPDFTLDILTRSSVYKKN